MPVIVQTKLAQYEPHSLMVDATACRAAFGSLVQRGLDLAA
jgi:hypothetical protein